MPFENQTATKIRAIPSCEGAWLVRGHLLRATWALRCFDFRAEFRNLSSEVAICDSELMDSKKKYIYIYMALDRSAADSLANNLIIIPILW